MQSLESLINIIKNLNVKLPEPFKSNWVDFLRSGQYEQGYNRLAKKGVDNNIYYCCLGVAAISCNIDLFTDKDLSSYSTLESIYDYFDEVPIELRGNTILQKSLYHLNDQYGLPFVQIADVIEQNL